jgi:uncharacterized surface protein with fasciclin (FAS1) repeats
MKLNTFKNLIIAVVLLFSTNINSQNILSAVDNTKQYKTIELINMDKNLSIFSNLLTLSGLDISLAFTNYDHSLFIPNNAAFTSMSINDFAKLTNPNNRAQLLSFVNSHFVASKFSSYDIKESDFIGLPNNKRINISTLANTVRVNGEKIIQADIESANGVIHVIDGVIKDVK